MKNQPAFPVHSEVNLFEPHAGMTLRDYFAAKAMQVVMPDNRNYPFDAARAAYEFADAMLKYREKA